MWKDDVLRDVLRDVLGDVLRGRRGVGRRTRRRPPVRRFRLRHAGRRRLPRWRSPKKVDDIHIWAALFLCVVVSRFGPYVSIQLFRLVVDGLGWVSLDSVRVGQVRIGSVWLG